MPALSGARGWHPAGRADASGFAAMACDEMLVHTHDAGRGLAEMFTPPPDLSDATLRRLFSWAPTDAGPWRALLGPTGMPSCAGRKRLTDWRWHCAPLAEWDGVAP